MGKISKKIRYETQTLSYDFERENITDILGYTVYGGFFVCVLLTQSFFFFFAF